MCSGSRYLVVISPTTTNTSYEGIDLHVVVEYSGPQLINSTQPLLFRYAGNPDIHAIGPRRIPNRFVYFVCVHNRRRNCLRLVNAFIICNGIPRSFWFQYSFKLIIKTMLLYFYIYFYFYFCCFYVFIVCSMMHVLTFYVPLLL